MSRESLVDWLRVTIPRKFLDKQDWQEVIHRQQSQILATTVLSCYIPRKKIIQK